MSQHDYNIANQTFPNTRSDINNALSAIVTNNSGSTSPSTTFAYQWWYDETNNQLKMRNSANDAWIVLGTFNQTSGVFTPNNVVPGRNLIINGSGRINQRGYTSGDVTSAANEYTLDRWRVVTSGQSLQFTGNDAKRTMTAPSGGVEQVVEGNNIVGGTYTITFEGTATCTVGGVTKSSGDTVVLGQNTNTTVRFTSGTFTNVQLEFGEVATEFEYMAYSEELARCQRYFFKEDSSIQMFSIVDSGSSVDRAGICWFPVEMRDTPTVSTSFSFGTLSSETITKRFYSVQANAFNSSSGNFFSIEADAEL